MPNLLDLLLAAHGNRRDQARQLRDQVIAFIGAGVETTAQALSWAWYLLALHGQCGNRLHDELDAELSGSVPQMVDLPRLSYTRWHEVLRLYPPARSIRKRTPPTTFSIQGTQEREGARQPLRHPSAQGFLAATGTIQAGTFCTRGGGQPPQVRVPAFRCRAAHLYRPAIRPDGNAIGTGRPGATLCAQTNPRSSRGSGDDDDAGSTRRAVDDGARTR